MYMHLCGDCTQYFKTPEERDYHRRASTHEYRCHEVCGLAFNTPKQLENHTKYALLHNSLSYYSTTNASGKQVAWCPDCRREFAYLGALIAHLRDRHGLLKRKPKTRNAKSSKTPCEQDAADGRLANAADQAKQLLGDASPSTITKNVDEMALVGLVDSLNLGADHANNTSLITGAMEPSSVDQPDAPAALADSTLLPPKKKKKNRRKMRRRAHWGTKVFGPRTLEEEMKIKAIEGKGSLVTDETKNNLQPRAITATLTSSTP